MIIYLAGGIHGNCLPLWKNILDGKSYEESMDLYLAGTNGRRFCVDLYLAGNAPWKKEDIYDFNGVNILESFFYADEWTEKAIPRCKNFLLDSGAFTFMQSKNKDIDWYEYLDRYANFIVKNNVDKFFELDLDSVIGYEKTLELRKELEQKTGKKCIPVWHKSRGMDEYIKMCKEYDYVAIGGIVVKEILPKDYKYFPYFIKIAHENGAKVHGLGFTNLTGIRKYHFDSVDSTAWTTGNRFGAVYKFNGKSIIKISKPEGCRLINPREVAINNFNEWAKFSDYAEKIF